MRWVGLILFVVLPLFFLPEAFRQIEIRALLLSGRIEETLIFSYADGRNLKCWHGEQEEMNYVLFPSYTDMSRIGISTKADRVDLAEGDTVITLMNGEEVTADLKTDVVYNLSIYRNKSKKLCDRQVTFLKSEGLPTLYVTTESGKMDRLNADKTYKEKGNIELLDTNGTLLFAEELRNISGRGNHTFTFEKKSYLMNFIHDINFFDMGESDSWVLLCNVYDPAYIRNKLVYEMALQAQMPGSPRSEYVDVYFNGEYGGIYQLCERVDIGKNRLEIADLEAANQELNGPGLEYANPFLSEEGNKKGFLLHRSPADITGGYLLERDYGSKALRTESRFTTALGDHFTIKNPKYASREEVEYISSLMQEIEDAITASDGINPYTGKYYTEYIDLQSWADKYLVEEITENQGGGCSSSYFYKPQDSLSTKVYGGPVWDYDKAFGNAAGFNKDPQILGFLTLHDYHTTWFYYLYQHEDFVEIVKKEYQEKFSDYLSVMAEEKVDEYISQIEAAIRLDKARFGYIWEDAPNYLEQAEYVKRFLLERKAFLDDIWLDNAKVCMVRFCDENREGTRCFGVKAGKCVNIFPEHYWEEGLHFLGWQIAGTDSYLTTETPVYRDIMVYCAYERQDGG